MSRADQSRDAGPLTDRERRCQARRRTLKAGIIAFQARHSTLDCVVRDFSATGARLRVDASQRPPDGFDLIIELDGLEVPCRVIWRHDNEIGVIFTSPPQVVAPRRAQVVRAVIPERLATLRRKSITERPDCGSPLTPAMRNGRWPPAGYSPRPKRT
jgi:PilZ domain